MFETPGEWTLVECRDHNCGLLWLDPMPAPEDIHQAYRQYYTHGEITRDSWARRIYHAVRAAYLSNHFGYPSNAGIPLLPRLLASLAAWVPHLAVRFDASVMWLRAKPQGRLLEIGCGRGDLLHHLSRLGWEVQGIDPDPKAAATARERGLNVSCGSLESVSFADESFDAIIMSHVIEHLYDPIATVRECHRILKSGGRLVLLTPNTGSLGHSKYGRNWLHLDPPRHLHLFNMANLPKIARNLRFSRMECFSVIRDADWTLGASRQIEREGKYKMGRLPFLTRVWGYWLMYVERLVLAFNPGRGEEIVFLAEK